MIHSGHDVMEPSGSIKLEEAENEDVPYIVNGNRREYKDWFKAQVVEECYEPGASVSIVARRHDINTNVLFRWRLEYRNGILKPSNRPPTNAFVAAGVIGDDGKLMPPPKPPVIPRAAMSVKKPSIKALPAPVPATPQRAKPVGAVEMHLSGRIKIRIEGNVEKDTLRRVFAVVREFA